MHKLCAARRHTHTLTRSAVVVVCLSVCCVLDESDSPDLVISCLCSRARAVHEKKMQHNVRYQAGGDVFFCVPLCSIRKLLGRLQCTIPTNRQLHVSACVGGGFGHALEQTMLLSIRLKHSAISANRLAARYYNQMERWWWWCHCGEWKTIA